MKKVIRWFMSLLGGFIGFELFLLLRNALKNVEIMEDRYGLNKTEEVIIAVTIVILTISIFYKLAPLVVNGTNAFAKKLEINIRKTSPTYFAGGVIGLLIGLIFASILSNFYRPIVLQGNIYFILNLIIYAFLGLTGYKIGTELIAQAIERAFYDGREFFRKNIKEVNEYEYNPKEKKNVRVPKILDTSVIIDGRVQEILRIGFLEGPIIIPEFVLIELQHISDSSDDLKRAKGRRGLDILKKMQEEFNLEVYNTDNEKALKDIPEVDIKLLKLAQILKGKVVTNDFNLNKVAQVKGIPVLNINELANAIKPIVIPGEELKITLIKQGKDRKQAIGYLEDGTMVVVEDGLKLIGENITTVVTSVIQTQAGRMLFGKVK